ncbi:MAG: heme A synthase [Actinobacteria bacterium]|nr:heme A synthase [Actinomycetota bacterium]
MKLRLERVLSPMLGLLLFLQAGILVTGGIVRLTSSGLGCPTWPRCTENSINPEPDQIEGQFHAWIEFGNRLITIVLVFIALACLLAVVILKRRDIRALAIGQVAGIFAQIPLGGITVLTHLNPFSVAAHFLLSVILIAAATTLFDRRAGGGIRLPELDLSLRAAIKWTVALTALVIIFGTGVTGTGPHAGDSSAPRFQIQIQTITWIHASLVIALLAAVAYILFTARENQLVRQRVLVFSGLVLVQGLIGVIQFNQGFPELLVGSHLLGVTLVWISAWRINLLTFRKPSIRKGK